MVDLGRWVNEEYRLPGKPVPSEPSDAIHSSKDSSEDP